MDNYYLVSPLKVIGTTKCYLYVYMHKLQFYNYKVFGAKFILCINYVQKVFARRLTERTTGKVNMRPCLSTTAVAV